MNDSSPQNAMSSPPLPQQIARQPLRGVAMLVNKFPPVPAGGAERQAERLSIYLASKGVHVGVITRSAPGLPRQELRDGFWVERIPQPGVGKLRTLTFMIGAAIALVRRRQEYDILHAHLAFAPALVGALIAQIFNKRVVVKYGTSGQYGDVGVSQRTRRGRIRLALLRRWTDLSIALDEAMEQELLDAGFARERVIRMDNGIDAEAFTNLPRAEARRQFGLQDKIVALYTGRLVVQKSLPVLIQAFSAAVEICPQLHLILVGQGPERASLELQVRSFGLSSHITFAGNVEDVRPYLAAADLFVLPSAGEGISNALLEAMASGLACIATTVGGSAEVLEQGECGILVMPGDSGKLSAALIKLAQSPAELARLGDAGRRRILARYSLSIVGDRYNRLYAQLLEDRLSHQNQRGMRKESL